MEGNFPPTQDSIDRKETLPSSNEKERPEKDRIGAQSSSQRVFCEGNIILSSPRESIKGKKGTPPNSTQYWKVATNRQASITLAMSETHQWMNRLRVPSS